MTLSQPVPAPWADGVARGSILWSPTLGDAQFMASVGNGYVATVIGSDDVFVAGVFNGNETVQQPSHRARIPSTAALNLSSQGLSLVGSALDMESAVFERKYTSQQADVSVRWYAHQTMRSLLVQELTISRNPKQQGALSFSTAVPPSLPSQDIAFSPVAVDASLPPQVPPCSFLVQAGSTLVAEEPFNPTVLVAVVSTAVPGALSLAANETARTWRFISAFRTSIDSADPVADALNDYVVAVTMQDRLLALHAARWRDTIWGSRIEIQGNLDLAQKVNSSLYYILSSLRADYPFGLSPGSLSSNAYNGHAFWDTESWMEPPLTLLHPELARSLIQYRFARRGAASRFAKELSPTYLGTAFPWETAAAGNNVCPSGYGTCTLEQHINGDIAFALAQYWTSTHDRAWLATVGYPTLLGIANFWASRVVYEPQLGAYAINHVIPPDEYAADVNNSVYTNVVASFSLNATIRAALELGLDFPKQWVAIAEHLQIPFDPVRQIHLEYDGYTDETVKQADVILLGFPLMYPMTSAIRQNDLDFYLNVTDPGGPAMTWAMFSIGYNELGQFELANELFERSFLNIRPPFDVWTETSSGSGAINVCSKEKKTSRYFFPLSLSLFLFLTTNNKPIQVHYWSWRILTRNPERICWIQA
ncbi:MAG: hypothetical protein Q8P67_07275 [archaeon]|nr:hypothetical protein [archaeon]